LISYEVLYVLIAGYIEQLLQETVEPSSDDDSSSVSRSELLASGLFKGGPSYLIGFFIHVFAENANFVTRRQAEIITVHDSSLISRESIEDIEQRVL